jgi:hypothetical protein
LIHAGTFDPGPLPRKGEDNEFNSMVTAGPSESEKKENTFIKNLLTEARPADKKIVIVNFIGCQS